MTRILFLVPILGIGLIGGCKREVRDLRPDPPVSAALNDVKPMAKMPLKIFGSFA